MAPKFISWLEKEAVAVEHGIEKIFAIGEKVTEEALDFLPLLSEIDPPVGALATTIAATALTVERQFAAAGAQSGSGSQKLAAVVATVAPVANHLLGPGVTSTKITNIVQMIVNYINKKNLPVLLPQQGLSGVAAGPNTPVAGK